LTAAHCDECNHQTEKNEGDLQHQPLVVANHRLSSSAVARFTLMRSTASQFRISQLAGWSIFWARAWCRPLLAARASSRGAV
jgi:hypothetical protein